MCGPADTLKRPFRRGLRFRGLGFRGFRFQPCALLGFDMKCMQKDMSTVGPFMKLQPAESMVVLALI